jgi:Zn-dependent protease with chaperone function
MRSLEEYQDLIARAERLAVQRPRRYKLRLGLLACLGIGYVVLMTSLTLVCILVVLALVIQSRNVILLKVALVPLGFGYVLVRAICFRLPPPEGRRVTPDELPGLFAEIEHVRRALNAKRVHEVLLTPDFNAAVVQIPRLGLLGFARRYLIVGLPMLASLPPYQFRAVLAHEFGHLARNHARFGNWIYRIRQTWHRLLDALEHRRSAAGRLVTRFFDWYAPYFNAYSFALARANEYEADHESARVTSKADAGDALAAVYTKGEYLDSGFWRAFYGRAATQPEPPAKPFTEYVQALRSIPAAESQAALGRALARPTGLNDTHPALAERLAALGVRPTVALSFQHSAAHSLLGDKRHGLMREFDCAWRESLVGPWKERHAFMQEMSARLSHYEELARTRALTEDEHWEYASTVEEIKGSSAALAVLDALLERFPRHAAAYYARGRILLAENQERGVADVERAMQLDEQAREPGSQLLYSYFYTRNQLALCDRYRQTLVQFARERTLAQAERSTLRSRDELMPHGLAADALRPWVDAVRGHKGVKRAWLARKRVQHLPRDPAYLLVIEFGSLTFVSQSTLQTLVRRLPPYVSCLVLNKSANGSAYRKIRKIQGSAIFPS